MTNEEAYQITKKLIANRGIAVDPLPEDYLDYLVKLIRQSEKERRKKLGII